MGRSDEESWDGVRNLKLNMSCGGLAVTWAPNVTLCSYVHVCFTIRVNSSVAAAADVAIGVERSWR